MSKLNVPYYKQNNVNGCGFITSKMILEYYDIKVDIKEMRDKIGVVDDRSLLTTEVALLLSLYGIKVSLYTKTIDLNENVDNFYKNILSDNLKKMKELSIPIFIEEEIDYVDFIESSIEKDNPIIILTNLHNNIESNHFIPVVGNNKDYFYVHDDVKFKKISKSSIFDIMQFNVTDGDMISVGN